MKKYLLFDHDGVLVDTEYWYYRASKRAMAELGIELELDAYLQDMSNGIPCWERARARQIDEGLIVETRARRDAYYQIYLKNENIEIPGVEDILAELAQDYRLAIITTSKRRDFDLIHQHRNILKHMEFFLTVEDYPQAKPHPAPYLAGLKQFDCLPEQALVVEDSSRGLKSAVAAGIDCIIVNSEFTRTHDFSKAFCKIDSLQALPGLLKNL